MSRSVGALLALLAGAASTGCVADRGWRDLPPDEARPLAADRCRLVVLVPERRIYLREYLYKFLWHEHREYSYGYDGIWDPAPFLEDRMIEALRSRWKIEVAPLRQGMEATAFSALTERIGGEALEGGPLGLPQAPVADVLRALRREGSEYLFEVYLEDLAVVHTSGGSHLAIHVGARLLRLSDGRVVWFRDDASACRLPGLNSFSELERDMLSPLKRSYEAAVRTLFRPDGALLEKPAPGAP